jgi:hypothetical protein
VTTQSLCASVSHYNPSIMMDAPTEDAGAFLPMKRVIHGGRKATKRTLLGDLYADEIQLAARFSPPSPQDEGISPRKKQRLDSITAAATNSVIDMCSDSDDEKPKAKENLSPDVIDLCSDSDDSDDEKPKAKEHSSPTNARVSTYAFISFLLGKKRTPVSAATAEAAIKTASPDAAMALSFPADADVDDGIDGYDVDSGDGDDVDDGANTDSVTDAQSVTARWTRAEDAKLASAVASICKKKWVEHYRKDWDVIAALVSRRTQNQCCMRWLRISEPGIAATSRRTEMWITDEDSNLRHAVRVHNGKNWDAIAALVPGRTKSQCKGRWHTLSPSIKLTGGHTGPWREDEDSKLRHAVRIHNGKNWDAIAALVPDRTKSQCKGRWHNALNPSIERAARHTGPWREDEDSKLRHAVRIHNCKNWDAIAALVPDRSKKQCTGRWHDHLKRTNGVIDLCSDSDDSDDEKPKAKEHSSPTNTHVGTYAFISFLLGKKRTPLSTAIAEAAIKTASPNAAMALPPTTHADVDDDINDGVDDDDDVDGDVDVDDHANVDSVTVTQPNAGATGRWTQGEDAKLTDAIAKSKKKHYIDWGAVASVVPGRMRNQCRNRWNHKFHPRIDQTARRLGKWSVDEDGKLKGTIQKHGGKNWMPIAASIPGRTTKQCKRRWHDSLEHDTDQTAGRARKWTEVEDDKLREWVRVHGGKDWAAITTLVPGRTMLQCRGRWYAFLNPSIALTAGRTSKWTEEEDNKLKNSIQLHGGKDGIHWAAIATLFPGRTKRQCAGRWHDTLKHSIDRTDVRVGRWTTGEDAKLEDAVHTHGCEDWVAIAALVTGRTTDKCKRRWRNFLDPSIKLTAGRTDPWTIGEDSKLESAVQEHGGKNWIAIAALIPGRTRMQCSNRWHSSLKHSIDKVK